MAANLSSQAVNTSPWFSFQLKKFGIGALISMVAIVSALVYLLPFGQMLTTAFKSADQIVGNTDGLILPMSPAHLHLRGRSRPDRESAG